MNFHDVTNGNLTEGIRLAITGLDCSVRTNSKELLRRLNDDWKERAIPAGEGFELSLVVDRILEPRTDCQPHFRGHGHLVFAYFNRHELFVFDLIRRVVSGVISERTAQDKHFWRTVLIPIAMGVLGPSMKLAPVHSACIAKDGEGLLIAGMSGAGKSTLSVALARRGFEFISDDWTYVRNDRGKLTAHGLRVPAKLMPDCVGFFPELRALTPGVAMNGELAYEARVDEVFGAQVLDQCAVRQVLFVERTGQRGGKLESIGGDLTREYFLKSAERLPEEVALARSNRSEIIDAIAQCDCWKLEYGGSPDQGVELVTEFMAGVRQRV